MKSADGKSTLKVQLNGKILVTNVASGNDVFGVNLYPRFAQTKTECELVGCQFMCKTNNIMYWVSQLNQNAKGCALRLKPDVAGIEVVELNSNRVLWPIGQNKKGYIKLKTKGTFSLIYS